MADTPQSQIILDQLVAWLSGIQIANGYRTDAGLDVGTEQNDDLLDEAPDPPPPPALLILDEDAIAREIPESSKLLWTQTYTLEGTVFDGGDGRKVCRRLLADIHRALRRRPTDWPPTTGVVALRESARSIPMRPSASDWLTPSVTIDIDFVDRED